jgi:hypothetical protein
MSRDISLFPSFPKLEECSHLLMLAAVGYELYRSNLIGNAPPSSRERFQRMTNPQPGDLVIEVSTSGYWLHPSYSLGPYEYLKVENVIGILEKITREPYLREYGEPTWNEKEEGKPEPLEDVIYLRLLASGDTFTWRNAQIVTILPKDGWHTKVVW